MEEQQPIFEDIHNSPSPALIIDPSGVIQSANLPLADLLRHPLDDLTRLTFWDLLPPEQHPPFRQAGSQLVDDSNKQIKTSFFARDCQLVPVEINLRRLENGWLRMELRDLRPPQTTTPDTRHPQAILHAVIYAARHLLQSPSWDANLNTLLARLGVAAGVSRVYLFKHQHTAKNELRASLRFEWTAAGVSPQIDNPDLHNVDYTTCGLLPLYHAIREGETIAAALRELSPAVQRFLGAGGALSTLLLPVMSRDGCWGFMGFDEHRTERIWQPYELDALRAAVSMLAAFIERQKMETALRAQQDMYRLLVENQGEGIALVDDSENFIFCNPATEKIFGTPPGGLIGHNLAEFLTDDQITTIGNQTRLRRQGHHSRYELTIRTRSGGERIISVSASPYIDKEQRYIGAFGVIQDITERKRTEKRIRLLLAAEQSYRRQAEAFRRAANALIHDLSTEQVGDQVLEGLMQIVPYQRCRLILEEKGHFFVAASRGYPAPDPWLGKRVNKDHACLQAGASNGKPWYVNQAHNEPALKLMPNDLPAYAWMCIPLMWNDRINGYLSLFRIGVDEFNETDAVLAETFAGPAALSIQNARLFSETQRLARIDPLTGLFNRRFLFELGQRELERVARHKQPVSVLLIDLDEFKHINDHFGHMAGDRILQQVARRMSACLRRSDLLGRYGGDEFVALLVETDLEQAKLTAQRLRSCLNAKPFRVGKRNLPVSACFGIAMLDDETGTLEALINHADQAMYTAKRSGGNSTSVWQPAPLDSREDSG